MSAAGTVCRGFCLTSLVCFLYASLFVCEEKPWVTNQVAVFFFWVDLYKINYFEESKKDQNYFLQNGRNKRRHFAEVLSCWWVESWVQCFFNDSSFGRAKKVLSEFLLLLFVHPTTAHQAMVLVSNRRGNPNVSTQKKEKNSKQRQMDIVPAPKSYKRF